MTDAEKIERLNKEIKELHKALSFIRSNIPDYLPEYNSGESPSQVVKECSMEIALGLVRVNTLLNILGIDYEKETIRENY